MHLPGPHSCLRGCLLPWKDKGQMLSLELDYLPIWQNSAWNLSFHIITRTRYFVCVCVCAASVVGVIKKGVLSVSFSFHQQNFFSVIYWSCKLTPHHPFIYDWNELLSQEGYIWQFWVLNSEVQMSKKMIQPRKDVNTETVATQW